MITTMHISCTSDKAIGPAIEKLESKEDFIYVAKSTEPLVDIVALYHTKKEEGADVAYNMAKSIVKGKDKIEGIYEVECYTNYMEKSTRRETMKIMKSAMGYLAAHKPEYDGVVLARLKSYSARSKCK